MARHGTCGGSRSRGATALLAALAVALLLPFTAAAEPTIKFNSHERDYRGIAVEEGVYQYHALSGRHPRWADLLLRRLPHLLPHPPPVRAHECGARGPGRARGAGRPGDRARRVLRTGDVLAGLRGGIRIGGE